MKRKFSRKTAMGFFRRKSIAIFMAFLMVAPQMSLGMTPSVSSLNNSVRQGAIKTGKVDMASGNLAFTENIFSLKGYKLTLKYNTEGLHQDATTINGEKPTGVVGLGWKLAKDRIVRLTHQTANSIDDEYILNAHGKISKLTFEYKSNDTLHYRLHSNPYWKILYLSDTEQWIVQKESGKTYIYGDGTSSESLIEHDANSTEHSVRWGNWIGSSVAQSNQNTMPVSWNLSAIDDMYGQRVELYYTQVKESVGGSSSALQHTRSAYLSKVIDMNGNYIVLGYRDKDADEFEDPHTENTLSSENTDYSVVMPDGDDDRDAFQERYEKKYLKNVSRYSAEDVMDRKVKFTYDFVGSGSLKKRVLTEIQYLNSFGGKYQPSTQYDYFGLSTSDGVNVATTYDASNFFNSSTGALYGAIKSVTIPGGGTYLYKYDEKTISGTNREFDIPFPSDYSYTDINGNDVTTGWRAPVLFFMDDYVVVLHELNAYDMKRTNISICTWVGDHWRYQSFGDHAGHFYDRYHAEDYHVKNLINSIKTSLLTGISDQAPGIGALMNAFNDDITDQMYTIYDVGDDLSNGDVTGAISDYMQGNFDLISDVAQDIFQGLEDQIDDWEDMITTAFGIKTHLMSEQELADDEQDYNSKNPRKKYHITLQKDFFALISTAGTTIETANDTTYTQSIHIFEKDPLIDGKWAFSAYPAMVSSKYMDINSGTHFINIFDECLDAMFNFTRFRFRTWNSQFYRVNQVLSDDEMDEMSSITANSENAILDIFGSLPAEDQDYLNLLSVNKRSSVSARNNFILVATSEADGSNARIQMFHHDENKVWNWENPSEVTFDKTLIPIDVAGDMRDISQGLSANSLLDLKVGNSIAALQVYDNLNMEAYNDVMSAMFGGAGTTDGSTDPLNPFSSLQSDLIQDLSAMNATYGIVWDENMENLSVQLLHAGIGQTGMKMYVNGNVIQKVGKAYSAIIGAQEFDENGTNYAFRYDGEKFVSQTFQSDYFSSAMAPDVATQLNEADDKAYKIPEFQQYYANRPVTSSELNSSSTLGNVVITGSDLSRYNAAEVLANVPGTDQWTMIDNASQEQINAPEFVKEAIHLASDILNLVIQIIMMIIPFAQEIAAAEKIISVIDKVTQVAGLAAMVLQPAADALVDKILGVNHKSTSIANNYIATNGKLFSRNPDGSWTGLGRAYDMNEDTDDIVGINNTLSNGHYNYTVKFQNSFDDSQNGGSSTAYLQNYVTLLKNRSIYRAIPFNRYVDGDLLLVRKDSLYLTDGNNAFVAYGPANDDGYIQKNEDIVHPTAEDAEDRRRKMSYEDATIVKLYRIADDNVEGPMKDYVVRSVETNTGMESTYMHYQYDNSTATYSDAHGAAIYPKVDVIPSNQASFTAGQKPFGYTSYYFFNSRNFYGANSNTVIGHPAQLSMPTTDQLVTYESFDHRDTADFNIYGVNPLHGRQYLMQVHNSDDEIVHRRIDCHLLYTADFFHRNGNDLLLDHVYQPLSSVVINETDGILNRKVNTYDYTYNATVLRTVANYSTSIDGEEEVHFQSKTYAFEHYPDILDQNRIKETSFVIDSVRKGNTTYILDATASSYKKWASNNEAIWDVEHIYKANLTDDILDTTIVNYQAVAAAEVAAMDADLATYDALLTAYEEERGDYSLAVKAAISSNSSARDSYEEVLTTKTEIVAAQHELSKSITDLEENNSEMQLAEADMTSAYNNYLYLDTIYHEAQDAAAEAYAAWESKKKEEEIVVGTLAASGNIVAAGIALGVYEDEVKDKWDDYQDALAAIQDTREAKDTAYDDYLAAGDVYNDLSDQHEALQHAVDVAYKLVDNAIDAFDAAEKSSEIAHSFSAAACNISGVKQPDLTQQSHDLAKSQQDTALAAHNDYISVAADAKTAIDHVLSATKRYESQTWKTFGDNQSSSWGAVLATDSKPQDYLEPYPYLFDFNNDGYDDLLLNEKFKTHLNLGSSSVASNFIFGGATTHSDKTKKTKSIEPANVGLNGYSLFKFHTTQGLSLVDYDNATSSFYNYLSTNWGAYSGTSSWGSNWVNGSRMRAGDLDGSGQDDLLVFLNNETKVIYDPKENSDFSAQTVSTDLDLPYTGERWVVDINNDGYKDLVGYKNSALVIHLSQVDEDGNHSFATSFTNTDVDFSTAGISNVNGMAVKMDDISGDGLIDIIALKTGNPAKIKIAYGALDENGDVGFTDLITYSNNIGNVPNVSSFIGDYNNDGEKEFSAIFPSTTTVYVNGFPKPGVFSNLRVLKLKTDTVYNDVISEVGNAKLDLDSTITAHNTHIEDLKTQKTKHDDVISKVDSLNVKESDIEQFDGQIYKWYKSHSILNRDFYTGYAITTADEKNVKTSDLYDKNSRNIVASVVDADFKSKEAIYCGFEDYEDVSNFKLHSSGNPVYMESYVNSNTQAISEDVAHAGQNSLYFYQNQASLKLKPANFSPNPELSYADSAYVISAFVKGTSSSQIWVGADSLQFSNAPLESRYDPTDSDWQYIEGVVIGSDLLSDKIPTLHIDNTSGVYVDDICIRPLAAGFEATVYNDLDLPVAKINANGLTKHMYYDSHNRLSTIIDDSGRIYGLNLAAFSRDNRSDDLFSQQRPNESTKFSFLDRGGLFHLDNSNKFSGQMEPHDHNQHAISFSLEPSDVDAMNVSFTFMGVPVSWQNETLDLSSDASDTLTFSEVPLDFTFAAMGDIVYIWINGKLIKEQSFDYNAYHSSSNGLEDIFTWSLQSASIKDDVIIRGENPVFKVDYTNGIGQHLQSIRPIFNNSGTYHGTVSKATLYDGWGNVAVSSLPMYSSTKSVEYKQNLITGIDWRNGEMTGDISNYYMNTDLIVDQLTNDYKYPYFRSYYENSPLSRLTKRNKPGEDFYKQNITTTVSTTTQPEVDQDVLDAKEAEIASLQADNANAQTQIHSINNQLLQKQQAVQQIQTQQQLQDFLAKKKSQKQQGSSILLLLSQKKQLSQTVQNNLSRIADLQAEIAQMQAPVITTESTSVQNDNADINATKVEYQGAEGDSLLLQFNLSKEKYTTKKTTSSLGHKTIEVTDKMGRKVMTKKGSAISQSVNDFNTDGFSKKTVKSPNHFAALADAAPGDEVGFESSHEQEDLMSFSDVNISPDRGQVELVKDQKGKVVFIKTATSNATDSLPGAMKYYLYDEQDRVIEQGISFARWDKDRLSTISKAPFCYDTDMQWVKRYKYDIDDNGSGLNNKGKITKTTSRDGEFTVESKFAYNLYGQITKNILVIKNKDGDLISEKTIVYEYYSSGQVKSINYPNNFTLIYSFNRQGKIKSIGTKDDLDLFATYAYDELDRVSQLTRKNNAYTAYKKYDLRGRNKDLKWMNTNSNVIFRQQMEFFRDNQYFDTKISKLKYSGSLYSDVEHSFNYDNQDRLSSSSIVMNKGTSLESTINSSYTYDANSNVKSYDTGQGTKTISYRAGTNQDLVQGNIAYNADGLKTRFNSPIWGYNSAIAYDVFSNKAQQFYKYQFPGSFTNYVHSNVWYKLSAQGFGDGVLTVDLKSNMDSIIGDGLAYSGLEPNDIQLFRFVKSSSNSSVGHYNIKCKSDESLNLFRTSDDKLVFDKAGSTGYYSDSFHCTVDGSTIKIKSLGDSNGMSTKVLSVSTSNGEEVLTLETESNVSDDNKKFRMLAFENAKPASDFILFSHDAKNNRVIKIRDIVDTDSSVKKDTLIYIHGNNRLPLSEYMSGVKVSGGVETPVKTISNYIYGPEFGSIGVRVYDLTTDQ